MQELEEYRAASLNHYYTLKDWLCLEEYRLDFIRSHLDFTLAAVQGRQVDTACSVADTVCTAKCSSLFLLFSYTGDAVLPSDAGLPHQKLETACL